MSKHILSNVYHRKELRAANNHEITVNSCLAHHPTEMVMWGIAIRWRPSTSVVVVIVVVVCVLSHFNPLLWNHRTNWNQTWYECSLDDPLKNALIRSTQNNQEAQMCQKWCCQFLIFFSETIGPIGTKLGMNVHLMVQ